ncbi:MAG: phosphotransacetylase [Malacoplasma sp.]|nr:phosphotransacetylase [Malacoplasma sp.]
MSLLNELKSSIQKANRNIRIVFAEGWNEDIQKAIKEVIKISDGKIIPILIFKNEKEANVDLPKTVEKIIIGSTDLNKYANIIYEARKLKGVTQSQAVEMSCQPFILASAVVASGDADGEICGIEYTTQDTIRGALQIVKAAPNVKTVSSAFIMEKGTKRLVMGDCAINLNPDAETLVQIVRSIAPFAVKVANIKDPHIALLSYSTAGSGKGESAEKVRKAYEFISLDESFMNKYNVFGDLQFDAAYDVKVQNKKAKNLDWNKSANVFVFPNIDAGNIGYKIAQRLGGYQAIGPVVLGLNKPVNDLSRGATSDDVVMLTLITATQALKLI